jgi:hypothetical protein
MFVLRVWRCAGVGVEGSAAPDEMGQRDEPKAELEMEADVGKVKRDARSALLCFPPGAGFARRGGAVQGVFALYSYKRQDCAETVTGFSGAVWTVDLADCALID